MAYSGSVTLCHSGSNTSIIRTCFYKHASGVNTLNCHVIQSGCTLSLPGIKLKQALHTPMVLLRTFYDRCHKRQPSELSSWVGYFGNGHSWEWVMASLKLHSESMKYSGAVHSFKEQIWGSTSDIVCNGNSQSWEYIRANSYRVAKAWLIVQKPVRKHWKIGDKDVTCKLEEGLTRGGHTSRRCFTVWLMPNRAHQYCNRHWVTPNRMIQPVDINQTPSLTTWEQAQKVHKWNRQRGRDAGCAWVLRLSKADQTGDTFECLIFQTRNVKQLV